MVFDTLIIGGGVSGIQCALVLGGGLSKPFAINKKVGIILHQRASHLQNALFNNALGIPSGTLGKNILQEGKKQLSKQYPEIIQTEGEKVISIHDDIHGYFVKTNKNEYKTKIAILALNYSKPFTIKGLDEYLEPHQRANPIKDRIQLRNKNHLVKRGLYVCGTIAGCRSQYAIAAGSGAIVATEILTLWNEGTPTHIHDKI